MKGKRNVVHALNMAIHRMPGCQVLHPQDLIANGMLFAGVKRGQLTSHHHGDNVVFIHTSSVTGADMLTITNDTDGVGNGFYFIELVRNINAGNTVILQVTDDIQQDSGFLLGQ